MTSKSSRPPSPAGVSPEAGIAGQRPPGTSTETRIDRIAKRAHEIYEARGGEHGKALEDWLRAEREIDAELDGEEHGSRG